LRPQEAGLVDELRAANLRPWVSLVADDDGVCGHILFTPVSVVRADGAWQAMALGPMAVSPARQRQGIGGRLIRAGLAACKEAGHEVVFVLGHADYYPRFGFRPTRPLGITCEFEVAEPYFMVAELEPGALAGRTGEVRYHPLFKNV
jgi:putative acetyltransferase